MAPRCSWDRGQGLNFHGSSSWDRRLLGALLGGLFGGLAVQDDDPRAGLELVLAVDHDLLVGLEARVDERLPIADLSDAHRPDLGRVVGLDHVSVGPFLALLHNRGRHGQAVAPGLEQQPRIDELARPKAVHLVGEVCLELDRTGGLDDLVVDETQRSLVELYAVVLVVGDNGQRTFGLDLMILNLRQDLLRKREDQRNRLDLRDYDHATGARWGDDIAHVDLADASDAIDRRSQARIAELQLGRVDDRLVCLNGVLQLRHLRLLGVEQLLRRNSLLIQGQITIEIGERIGELRLIAIANSGQLIDLRLVGARIDLREKIAGPHGLPFGEVDADDLPLDLRPY